MYQVFYLPNVFLFLGSPWQNDTSSVHYRTKGTVHHTRIHSHEQVGFSSDFPDLHAFGRNGWKQKEWEPNMNPHLVRTLIQHPGPTHIHTFAVSGQSAPYWNSVWLMHVKQMYVELTATCYYWSPPIDSLCTRGGQRSEIRVGCKLKALWEFVLLLSPLSIEL